jgi:hypothetical protein
MLEGDALDIFISLSIEESLDMGKRLAMRLERRHAKRLEHASGTEAMQMSLTCSELPI